MKTQLTPPSRHCLAIALSGLANLFLGASSLYWRALNDIQPTTLVAYRVALSCAILTLLLLIFRRFNQTKIFTARLIATHCIASFFILINWGVFIWSSINGYILESGLGYLLAPFISIALGALVYHERMTPHKALSVLIAFSAIAFLMIFSKDLNHWIYLLIAATWGLYTYIKKSTSLNAVNGLFVETVFLTTCLAFAIWVFDLSIIWPNELPSRAAPLIWLAGLVSVIPLLIFSFATGKIPLSLTGLLQFTLPLTLLTIGWLSDEKSLPTLSLTLIITTAGILASPLVYDMTVARRPKK
ncbi:EamA family transporter [Pseudomonas veronii]|uniref:EamA family transporter n=1 Tax=Pseudomonas veronii TaxID=76761 RepID=UPI0012329018|nr:EamA family transporter [Pseudomonas veronii]KAA6180378.1 EamA family transporter [Pseudomonas veronii]